MNPMERDRYRDILEASVVFKGLEPLALEHILQHGLLLEARKDELVFYENMRGGMGLYVLLEGQVEIFRSPEPGAETPPSGQVHLNFLGPGQCLGEYSLMDGLTTSASARAVSDTWLFFFPRGEFLRVMDDDSGIVQIIYRNLLLYLIKRLRQKDGKPDAGSKR